ncbi:MAG: hypothetical protein K8S27_04985 [Candidatus Omnitrophica bacterium]|nr:hypothetical protein [Candidatus Omnitrophota bacterium]
MPDFLGCVLSSISLSDGIDRNVNRILTRDQFLASKKRQSEDRVVLGLQQTFAEKRLIVEEFYGCTVLIRGNIYNMAEIGERLSLPDKEFRSGSLAEKIVLIYKKKGVSFYEELNGDFALALYDESEHVLFLGVDKFSPAQIYYYFDGKDFVFSTTLQRMIQMIGHVPSLDPTAFSKYFAYGFVPAPLTLFNEIKKIPLGHFLVYNRADIRMVRYGGGFFSMENQPQKSEHAYAQEVYDRFLKAVKIRMNGQHKNGVFLSGGLDSSSVVASLSQFASGRELHTFTAVFSETSYNESVNARLVAERFHTQHQEILFTPQKAIDYVQKLIKAIDEPFADDDVICSGILSPIACQYADDVFLGDGPDELFMGYPSLFAHGAMNLYEKIPGGIRQGFEAMMKTRSMSLEYCSFDGRFKQFLGGLGYPACKRDAAWWGPFPPQYQQFLFHEDVLAGLDLRHENIYSEVDQILTTMTTRNTLEEIISVYLNILSGRWLLKLNAAARQSSINFKMPFFDDDFIACVNNIPARFKKKPKQILRKSFQRILPKEITRGKKRSFFVPLPKWMKENFSSLLSEHLSLERLRELNMLNPAYVHGLIDQHKAGKVNHAKQIWSIFIFMAWYHQLSTLLKDNNTNSKK